MAHLLFAPDSFKGTLSADQVCAIWTEAAGRWLPGAECRSLPVSDGGEGLLDALRAALGGELVEVEVPGPLGRPVRARYLRASGGTAVVEMAAASGLPLLAPGERDVLHASTRGTGRLIAHALDHGARRIILGLGGSATNDGGLGAAAELGLLVQDARGRSVEPSGAGAGAATAVDAAPFRARLRGVELVLACDVNNPLCGPKGASAVYGPQKGASPADTALLDRRLARLAALLERDSGRAVSGLPGCGAAGGLALPFLCYTGAALRPGVDIVLDALDFDRALDGCTLVLTGEGRTDGQSAMGKAVSGVCRRAAARGVSAVVLSGALGPGAEALYGCGAAALFSACPGPMPLEDCLAGAEQNLRAASESLFRLLSRPISSIDKWPQIGYL